jgi:CRISPR-associated protein Cas1
MPVLYVTEPGATVRLSSRSLSVTVRPADGRSTPELRAEVELHLLEVVALVGAIHLTYDALSACLEQGIGVAWLTPGGRLRGRMVPEMPRSADLRSRQYEAFRDEAGRLVRARRVVEAKLANAAAVLRGLRSNHPLPELAAGLAALREQRERLAGCSTAASLLGMEGTGARAYFDALAAAFVADISSAGRQRRPPPDPANALLSLGYTMLAGRLAGLLEARGLDPAWGFFHEDRPGRPSLALDLLEELRHPVVDRFVVRGCNLRVFQPRHFEADAERPGGVRLTREGWRLFLGRWEEHLRQALRDKDGEVSGVEALLLRQVERLVADLRGGLPYAPYQVEE